MQRNFPDCLQSNTERVSFVTKSPRPAIYKSAGLFPNQKPHKPSTGIAPSKGGAFNSSECKMRSMRYTRASNQKRTITLISGAFWIFSVQQNAHHHAQSLPVIKPSGYWSASCEIVPFYDFVCVYLYSDMVVCARGFITNGHILNQRCWRLWFVLLFFFFGGGGVLLQR